MTNGTFDFNLFIKETKDLLTNPKAYFASLRLAGGLGEPVLKAVIYGAVAGAIAFIWSILKIGAVTGGLLGGSIGIMVFISYIIGAVIGLFIGGVILLVISSICNGNSDFEANVRVTASIMVLMPLSALVSFTGAISPLLGSVAGLAVNIFGLWLLFNALAEALKAKPESARIAVYILAALFVLFTIIGYGAKKRANALMDDFNDKDLKELMKDMDEE
jgi:hypothetical protein